MTIKQLLSIGFFSASSLLLAPASHAAIVTWTVQGNVISVTTGFEPYFGSSIAATFIFDTDTPGVTPGVGRAYDAILSTNITSTNAGFILDINGGPSEPASFWLIDSTSDTLTVDGDGLTGNIPDITAFDFDWDVFFDSGAPFDSVALTELVDISAENLALSTALGNTFRIGDDVTGQTLASYEITNISSQVSTVPLPASVWLFGLAIASLTGLRVKRGLT